MAETPFITKEAFKLLIELDGMPWVDQVSILEKALASAMLAAVHDSSIRDEAFLVDFGEDTNED